MLFVLDKYSTNFQTFSVLEYNIAVESERIANAIAALPNEKRNIILLSYFLDMTDGEIGEKLNMLRRTVQRRRTSSLQELKIIMEDKADE